jgi:uncharacterized protein
MIIDCHVHVCATTRGHGFVSQRLQNSLVFRFMRLAQHLPHGHTPYLERAVENRLVTSLRDTPQLDAAVVLAFDAVYDGEGNFDRTRTHLYVSNDYVMALVQQHPRMLFGASIHPYRKDAVAELERCVRAGAVLLKWLPITQDINPADERCVPFYEALAHHRLPLLAHTGGEKTLPNLNIGFADPMLLVPALKRGVTVIAAHCGTRSFGKETDFAPAFVRLAHEYEHLYGDTAALNLPTRSYVYETILNDQVVRAKLVHGSDWPILPVPPLSRLGWLRSAHLLGETNWLRRDIRIKEMLGFDEAYWHRAAKVLRVARPV